MDEKDYNQLIKSSSHYRAPDISVVRFLKSFLWPRVEQLFLDKELSILEVGHGISSLFADAKLASLAHQRVKQVQSIDINLKAVEFMQSQQLPLGERQVFKQLDVTKEAWPHCFDLILDHSCFHCLTEKTQQQRYLSSVRRGLVPGGVYFLQSMVMPKKLSLEEGHELDKNTGVLKKDGLAWRRLVEAFEIEQMIIESGLEIEFFKVLENEKAVLSKERPIPMSSDPDILRVIARAPN
jgi:SAM-dependent methyltransferase